jgi:hypothetical protein
MSPIGEHSSLCRGPGQSLTVRVRAPQKLKPASGLQENRSEEPPRQQDHGDGRQSYGLACSGTQPAVSFRHAPFLATPFVAQLLGQVLPDCERPGSDAARAYGAGRLTAALLLDTRL